MSFHFPALVLSTFQRHIAGRYSTTPACMSLLVQKSWRAWAGPSSGLSISTFPSPSLFHNRTPYFGRRALSNTRLLVYAYLVQPSPCLGIATTERLIVAGNPLTPAGVSLLVQMWWRAWAGPSCGRVPCCAPRSTGRPACATTAARCITPWTRT